MFKEIPLESRVELASSRYMANSDNVFGELEEGSYIALKGMVVEAEMESNIYGCACVRRTGFGPQHVVPDCHVISTSSSSLSSKRKKITRRAVPTHRLDETLSEGQRSKGQVCCLLLFTTTRSTQNHACILILGKQPDGTYQRLGIGNSDSGCSRPLYEKRRGWEVWKDWVELEEWESWDRWFADAEIRTVKIV
jgi:hypothetical protein